ncbi:hypothetical protein C7T35_01370 [Variovorax sp. WS11]|uniref:hypothetical protein n=1 Tax=Variovorax sp. WS11 TaxID=1105204 RepID=UPI000D0D4A7F|nr:hypothetical protein [Variovorax sp. WS11]NDZ11498.1 hypothetical protein [Variovorax sp. WS11]PSL86645.1 hypothetical protein C7T35_01370 [Variovorax sp. WS11]
MIRSRSFLSTLAFAAAACILAGASAFSTVTYHVARTCTAVRAFVWDFVKDVTAKFESPALRLVARPVELVQACAYALRIAKRERPQVRPQWRMCPSI